MPDNLRMTTDADILEFAERLHAYARLFASHESEKVDVAAVSIAILVDALKMATPGLSPQGRARLFLDEA